MPIDHIFIRNKIKGEKKKKAVVAELVYAKVLEAFALRRESSSLSNCNYSHFLRTLKRERCRTKKKYYKVFFNICLWSENIPKSLSPPILFVYIHFLTSWKPCASLIVDDWLMTWMALAIDHLTSMVMPSECGWRSHRSVIHVIHEKDMRRCDRWLCHP